jgi:hypothetical protein
MKADDILTNSETATDEAIALGIEINKQVRKTKKILQANKTSDASAVAKLDDDLGLLKQGNTLITWQTLNTPH